MAKIEKSFPHSRHPSEGWDPGKRGLHEVVNHIRNDPFVELFSYRIPAFAGMTLMVDFIG
jgi:hypothetical protein